MATYIKRTSKEHTEALSGFSTHTLGDRYYVATITQRFTAWLLRKNGPYMTFHDGLQEIHVSNSEVVEMVRL